MFQFAPNSNLVITINPNQNLTQEAVAAINNGATLFDLFANDVFDAPWKDLLDAFVENTDICISKDFEDCPELDHPYAYLLDKYGREDTESSITNLKKNVVLRQPNEFVLPSEHLTAPISEFLDFLNDPDQIKDKLTYHFEPLEVEESIIASEPSPAIGVPNEPSTPPQLPIPNVIKDTLKPSISKTYLLVGALASLSLGLYLIHKKK